MPHIIVEVVRRRQIIIRPPVCKIITVVCIMPFSTNVTIFANHFTLNQSGYERELNKRPVIIFMANLHDPA
jgi:hypothetical protein